MKVAVRTVAVIMFLAVFAHADEPVTDFSLETLDGKTVEYDATKSRLL